jgi:hypothetical protein
LTLGFDPPQVLDMDIRIKALEDQLASTELTLKGEATLATTKVIYERVLAGILDPKLFISVLDPHSVTVRFGSASKMVLHMHKNNFNFSLKFDYKFDKFYRWGKIKIFYFV